MVPLPERASEIFPEYGTFVPSLVEYLVDKRANVGFGQTGASLNKKREFSGPYMGFPGTQREQGLPKPWTRSRKESLGIKIEISSDPPKL